MLAQSRGHVFQETRCQGLKGILYRSNYIKLPVIVTFQVDILVLFLTHLDVIYFLHILMLIDTSTNPAGVASLSMTLLYNVAYQN